MHHTMGIVDVHTFCTVDTLAEAYQRLVNFRAQGVGLSAYW
jgi:hypothetical protein